MEIRFKNWVSFNMKLLLMPSLIDTAKLEAFGEIEFKLLAVCHQEMRHNSTAPEVNTSPQGLLSGIGLSTSDLKACPSFWKPVSENSQYSYELNQVSLREDNDDIGITGKCVYSEILLEMDMILSPTWLRSKENTNTLIGGEATVHITHYLGLPMKGDAQWEDKRFPFLASSEPQETKRLDEDGNSPPP
ncbi:hypothetical protein llap_9979 [Limosa lapponica baueri]|uniref:Uncharacterized protein n=1 Tax=Limosa lapponica baueri TaxID=1758121 RepID=A0A2I0U0U9_LIMLA|nr:hypothetical protein llap_9979 [Limosa lapponica baueri]